MVACFFAVDPESPVTVRLIVVPDDASSLPTTDDNGLPVRPSTPVTVSATIAITAAELSASFGIRLSEWVLAALTMVATMLAATAPMMVPAIPKYDAAAVAQAAARALPNTWGRLIRGSLGAGVSVELMSV
ncbi:MAG: hypothetical protein EOO74_09030 [Myxococcales bacterium]|nr:MAG: hypothetical protein EOO74_09030 [Myxococcales bacterium]